MSAGVDQRNKGQSNQVSNGGPPKEGGDFDYLQNQPPQVMYDQNQGYGSQMNSQNDPYMSSYYHYNMSFQNMAQDGVNAGGPWSNGEHMAPFLSGGGYGQMGNDYNMYGGGPFDYQQFGWSFPGGDYNTWGGSGGGGVSSGGQQRKDDQSGGYGDAGYYGMGNNHRDAGGYNNMNGDMDRGDNGVKAVEQGLKGMGISDNKHDHGSNNDSHLGGGGGGQGGRNQHGGHHGGHSGGGGGSVNHGSSAPKKMTWASIASQPARPQPQLKPKSIPRAPVLPGKHDSVIGTWEGKNNPGKQGGAGPAQSRQAWGAPRGRAGGNVAGPYSSSGPSNSGGPSSSGPSANSNTPNAKEHPVLEKLKAANQYNPKEFNLNPKNSRFFIIKSYSEDDIHRSIKYGIWCSTEHGNKRLDTAFREREGKGPIYLLYSVNGSGHFCGMAQMMSAIDYNSSSNVWMQDKWKGQFEVKWIYVKDVPNSQLRHIRLENNENKPVTNSRDTQEVPPEKGKQVLKIMHHYRHTTSIFDDFSHYEVKQEDDKHVPPQHQQPKHDDRSNKGDWRGNKGGNNRGHPRDE